ncbi:hypothetical protein BGZ54_001677 [Gamsiella multidivaricata]|nr:hypothetical protein BGZ54_001677 [Gamsiella multidivaricata]
MREHIEAIRNDNFGPNTYKESGYALRGLIRTDGFRLQLLAFKLNELNAVKYRRLPEAKLSPRINSTLGGTDYSLTEIRNVVKTKQDVSDLWGYDLKQIEILGLDQGQAFVIRVSALLPSCEQLTVDQEQETNGAIKEPSPSNVGGAGEAVMTKKPSTKFYNLVVKQKAVYQPTLKHRRWLKLRKGMMVYASRSISSIESNLPHLHGSAASIKDYTDKLRDAETHLDSFYGSVILKKHKWNARKARDEEYKQIASRLLKLVEESLGAKREDSNKVIIGVGLG